VKALVRSLVPTPVAVLVAGLVAAQSPASLQRAVNSITADDITRRVGVLADDSMRGRDTPSPELEQTAAYIAGEFRRLGLKPGGDAGTYLQRYAVVRTAVDTAATRITVRAPGRLTALKAGVDINVLRFGPLPTAEISGPVVLFTREVDGGDPLAGADVKGAWAAQVITATPQGVQLDLPAAEAAIQAGAIGIVIISDRTDAQWHNRLRRITLPSTALEGGASNEPAVAVIELRDTTATRVLRLDMAAVRGDRRRVARRLEGITLTVRLVERTIARITAPNAVGILEGSDPQLKTEYVVYSAHMDHVGIGAPVNGDSVYNGADDDASGTAAVVEAAEAFARLEPPPKRSIIFLTVSGEEKGLWGSAYFTDHPPVPVERIVADLNMDMVGRNWRDTIAVIGKEHSDLGATLNRVAAAHPELRMQPIGDIWPQENFYFRSDHYNFARKGVPILFFFNGTHADYHQPSDEPRKIDGEKEARIVKLVLYLGLAVANSAERPRWNPESYKRIVESAGN